MHYTVLSGMSMLLSLVFLVHILCFPREFSCSAATFTAFFGSPSQSLVILFCLLADYSRNWVHDPAVTNDCVYFIQQARRIMGEAWSRDQRKAVDVSIHMIIKKLGLGKLSKTMNSCSEHMDELLLIFPLLKWNSFTEHWAQCSVTIFNIEEQ